MIFYGILDKRNLISDQRVRNYIDSSTIDLYSDLPGAMISESIDELLSNGIERGKEYACIIGTGHFTLQKDSLLDAVSNFCASNEFYVAGHIIMKPNQYPRLHYQMMIIDLKRHNTYGRPICGSFSDPIVERPAVLRSDENIHSDYTPTWVASADGFVVPMTNGFAQNLIAVSLANGLRVLNIPQTIRQYKKFIYPELQNDFGEALDAFIANRDYTQYNIDWAQNDWLEYLKQKK